MRADPRLLLLLLSCTAPESQTTSPSPQPAAPRAKAGQVAHLRICAADSPDQLDPAIAASATATAAVTELFDGVAGWNELGHPVPSLATTWSASKDLRTWTFRLRRGARWSNGREIVADDVRFQIARLLHPRTASVHNENLDGIRGARAHREKLARDGAPLELAALSLPDSVGVRAPDPHTLVIEFERPTPWAAYLLASSYLRPVPREALVEGGESWASQPGTVTSGAFRIAALNSESLVLEKSSSWWNAAQVKLDRVTMVVVDPKDSARSFADGICGAPPRARQQSRAAAS